MDKIYSRWRIRILERKRINRNPNTKWKRKLRTILLILLIAYIFAFCIVKAITPILEGLCSAEAKKIATKVSNQEATNVMERYKYQDLCSVEKDNNGNITMIKMNIIPINEITSDIANNIQDSFEDTKISQFSLKLGTLTGTKLLSGRGPSIPVKVQQTGTVETNVKSEFIEAGINQTLHRIYLEVKCNVSILTPYKSMDEEIINQVLLAESVIVGNIPSSYYNLEGLNKNNAVDVIE